MGHERLRDAASTQKIREKKWPLRRAAKFREETPRKGGGFAIKDHNTALQQYGEVPICPQGQICPCLYQNAAETLIKSSISAWFRAVLLPPAAIVHCTKLSQSPTH
ncbi:MAG TPA: hypothetical protein VFQ52_04235 [Rhizomicrobium sp.]|nr:hypothetical protein [Rhizomicrobium sp.]